MKTLFALLVTHKEKRPSRMPVNLKKTEFAPAGVQAGGSSRTFHPKVTGVGGKVQSKKLSRLKRNLLHLHHSFTIIGLRTVKQFQVLSSNTHNVKYYS